MVVRCKCCVLSGRGLCDGLITCPEQSYRLWCVLVCDLGTSRIRRLKLIKGCKCRIEKKKLFTVSSTVLFLYTQDQSQLESRRHNRLIASSLIAMRMLVMWRGISIKQTWRYFSHSGLVIQYDRDKLWLVYTQSVPVIFEPPCTYLAWQRLCQQYMSLHDRN
jgi:hypothetical protein